MAFSTNGNGSRVRGRFQHGGTLSEINVTPFVDVLLVLLIIFMLTAHVMESASMWMCCREDDQSHYKGFADRHHLQRYRSVSRREADQH